MPSEMQGLPRLALAALASGATAGLLMTLAILLHALRFVGAGFLAEATAGGVAVGLAAGLEAGLIVAGPPAFLAGAAMCALGRRFEAARRAPAWAVAGAAGGALAWAAFAAAARIVFGEPGLARPADGVLLAAMLVGIGAALAFRAVAGPGRGEAR